MIERIIHKVDDQGVFSLLIKVEFSFVSSASFYAYLHEYGLRVPRFFCIPEQYEPEELDAYFAMHFQDVLQYHVDEIK